MTMQDRAKTNHDLGKDSMIYYVLDKGSTGTVAFAFLDVFAFNLLLFIWIPHSDRKNFSKLSFRKEKPLKFLNYFAAIVSLSVKNKVQQIQHPNKRKTPNNFKFFETTILSEIN